MANDGAVITPSGLERHRALLAWKRVYPGSRLPTTIDVVKKHRGSAVYRLSGVTRKGGAVIAKKRRDKYNLRQEARIYTEVFPALRLPVVDCYGYLDDFGGHAWLFLEDAGDVWYSPGNPAHCAYAIKWLACLHSTPSALVSNLHDCGPGYFRPVLEQARQGVRSSLEHPSVQPSVADVAAILDHLEVIEGEWTNIEDACSRVPRTLVHGDFVRKNVRVRGAGRKAHIVAFDWETAGGGSPAPDIAQLPGGAEGRRDYFEMLGAVWPAIALEDIERLFRIGTIFRLLHAIHWETYSLAFDSAEHARTNLMAYERALRDLVRDPFWAQG